jgi:hypothetical protein
VFSQKFGCAGVTFRQGKDIMYSRMRTDDLKAVIKQVRCHSRTHCRPAPALAPRLLPVTRT